MTEQYPQCWRCGRTLAEYLTPPWSLRCHRCKAQNRTEPEQVALTKATGNITLPTDK